MNIKNNNKIVFKKIINTFGIGFDKAKIFFERIGINQRNNPLFIKKKKFNDLNKLIKKI